MSLNLVQSFLYKSHLCAHLGLHILQSRSKTVQVICLYKLSKESHSNSLEPLVFSFFNFCLIYPILAKNIFYNIFVKFTQLRPSFTAALQKFAKDAKNKGSS